MMTDEIKKARLEFAALKAEGKAAVPVWKQVLGAVFSWQTAMVVGITVLTMYGREIANWTKELFKGRDAVNSLSEAIKKHTEGTDDIIKEMAKEKTSMKLNYLVAKDLTRSYEERLAAANNLISKYPSILGNFTSEQLLASGLSDTYAQLTKAIEKSFEARFAETKILDNYKEMAKQQKIIDEGGTMWGKFSRFTVKYTKDLDGAKNKIIQIRDENRKLFEQFNVVGEDKFGINQASKEFEIYSKLQSKETKKVFDERSSFVSKDAQTYKQWLINQLVTYKDNVDAKMALEQELATFIEKDKKGNKFTPLEQLQDQNKKQLEETAQYQQELLSNTELSDSQILQAKVDNAKELIRIRQNQIEEEKKISTKEQISALNIEATKNEKALAKSTADFVISEQKRMDKEIEDERKKADDKRKKDAETLSNNTLSDAEKEIHKEAMLKLLASEEEIKNAKGNADKIREIQDELELYLIESEKRILQAKLKSGNLTASDAEQVQKRINSLEEGAVKKRTDNTTKGEETKKQKFQETAQATNELLQQGLEFSQMIYSAQAERAQATYDAEMRAAGDNLEYQTLAKRKFEAEDKKIKQRQAIASKLQAVLDAGLALALAIATTWKNPFLAALNIGAATLGLGMALATPIPQFEIGKENTPDTFIAGDKKGSKGATELIKLKSGKKILTPAQPTLFSGSEFEGATVFPNMHNETQKMLANMAFNQVHDVVDLSKTNSHLASMDKQMKNKTERYIDSKGRTVVKRGTVTSIL
jgi:hypothetical protein